MLFGIILCGIGFIALAHTNSLIWFFVASSILTLGLTFGTFLVVSTAVANWFVQKKPVIKATPKLNLKTSDYINFISLWCFATYFCYWYFIHLFIFSYSRNSPFVWKRRSRRYWFLEHWLFNSKRN